MRLSGNSHAGAAGSSGTTLTAMLMGLGIMSLLVGLAVPAYGEFLAYYRLRSEAQALAGSMMLARAEAVKRNTRVNVCKTLDWITCAQAGGFETGWLIYQDPGHTGQPDPDELPIRVKSRSPDGITIRGNKPVADLVSYTTWGHARTLTGAMQIGTFTVCAKGLNAVQVVLASTGRVRIESTSDTCA